MKTVRTGLIGGMLAATITLAACGDEDKDSGSKATTSESATTAPEKTTTQAEAKRSERTGTTIQVDSSQFGDVIWDGNKQAIYLFDKEKGKQSECYDDCAVAWPPVLTEGEPQAKNGAEQDLLGTTTRKDGKKQVTYGGHPLYYYDEPPNEIRCHNVNEFGGLWLVVKPDGEAAQ